MDEKKGNLSLEESRELFNDVRLARDNIVHLKSQIDEQVHVIETLKKRIAGEWNEQDELKYVKFSYQVRKIDKIPAIKAVRDLKKLGLKEAKELVESWDGYEGGLGSE